jgi:ribonuclease R
MIEVKEGDVLEGQIEFSANGNAFFLQEEKDIFVFKRNTGTALHLDKVKIEVFKIGNKLEGRVIEVISRFKTQYVGRVQLNENKGYTFVIPDSNKIVVDFFIKGGLKAKDDQKVVVEFVEWKDSKSPIAKIIKVLGDSGDNNTEMNSIMFEYGLPMEFPVEVITESELIEEVITKEEINSRRDMRGVTTITIDPADAKDFDDALSISVNDKGIEIGVHIADVGHYVKVGTKLDDEAYKRATSVYLVDRCVPMLPERLSNGICSLKPNVDRLAFSVVFTLDYSGNIIEQWQGKTVIHSDRRFSYEEAQSIIEGDDVDFSTEIRLLDSLAKSIRDKRITAGSIEMGGVEVRFILAEDNKKPIGIYFKEQKDANKLIEEFMLLANKAVAKILSDAVWTNVYRTHDTPNIDKLNSLVAVCSSFGYEVSVDAEGIELKQALNKLLVDIKNAPEENMIGTLVTRCMSKAIYSIKNIGHYGLGFSHYSHFTSPIRRYPDLITHRILFDFLNNVGQGNPGVIEEQAKWCSTRELAASKAERDSIKYKQAEYLLDQIGVSFEGIVSSVTDWGLYVEITENKCEGMVRYTTLGGLWNIDTAKYLISNDSGDIIRLGDVVTVVVKSVDLEKKQIDFILEKFQ